ncbi:ATP-dependent 6-phosphofructokinase [Rhynchospora pubera]|uniref:ATP-dependent 6-phosphofructokinase n=1 Tax=Rhynchospora pubera TaxID=906938 RepID=A0AAV8FEM3_9POAL|nr:ATP-dependent 6-phosphofructokinase [Rhynchospora pubera]
MGSPAPDQVTTTTANCTGETSSFTPPSFTVRNLPHLSDYLPPTDNHTGSSDHISGALPSLRNPIDSNPYYRPSSTFYISPSDVVLSSILFDTTIANSNSDSTHDVRVASPLAYLRAGPRRVINFDPAMVRAAIVTCGGLCPWSNTVIRELVVGLNELYGVKDIYGIPMGYRGFYSADPIKLDPDSVHDWHKKGGTMLMTTRGGFDLEKIVDAIVKHGYNQLYVIGGDGTMRGALDIFKEFKRRKLRISITGVPKTVDNDIGIIDRSFGFDTAVEVAQQAISAAHTEAESAVNGIGLVKLMGRSTGHIALYATLSSRDVDCCLIPEMNFHLYGKGGLFEFIDQRLKQKRHTVIVVAEGAGQELIARTESETLERDPSGNPLFADIGVYLKKEFKKWWDQAHPGELFTVKYIDPTYMIRAVPANASDNLYCTLLAHSAIHGVMAGYTGFVSGPINRNYGYIPLEDIATTKNVVDTKDHTWAWVRSVTNQPDFGISEEVVIVSDSQFVCDSCIS